jgi:hypothetical protein
MRDEITAKVNEVDKHLKETITEWLPNRFPELWEMTYNGESLKD